MSVTLSMPAMTEARFDDKMTVMGTNYLITTYFNYFNYNSQKVVITTF